jgi:hypothetical protein
LRRSAAAAQQHQPRRHPCPHPYRSRSCAHKQHQLAGLMYTSWVRELLRVMRVCDTPKRERVCVCVLKGESILWLFLLVVENLSTQTYGVKAKSSRACFPPEWWQVLPMFV